MNINKKFSKRKKLIEEYYNKKMKKTKKENDDDFYSQEHIAEELENDSIDVTEAGFVLGWLDS